MIARLLLLAALLHTPPEKAQHQHRLLHVVRDALPVVLSVATLGVVLSERASTSITCRELIVTVDPSTGSAASSETCSYSTTVKR